jgi:2-amino-4-hydroxy-6-hydroxymethyldihydropteridine diphosphokinase
MIVLALGANLPSVAGVPEDTILAALAALAMRGVTVNARSHLWRTPAWPDRRDPAFINAAAVVKTALAPEDLLTLLHEVETQFGRDRSPHWAMPAERNAPRTLDLDLIDYNGRVQAGPPELPHPRIAERAFALLPLRDIAPQWRHPASGKTIDELIAALPAEEVADMARLE